MRQICFFHFCQQVRVRDWREGLLESKHLLRHLKSADWELQRYELEATPSGWSCSWDRYDATLFYFPPKKTRVGKINSQNFHPLLDMMLRSRWQQKGGGEEGRKRIRPPLPALKKLKDIFGVDVCVYCEQ